MCVYPHFCGVLCLWQEGCFPHPAALWDLFRTLFLWFNCVERACFVFPPFVSSTVTVTVVTAVTVVTVVTDIIDTNSSSVVTVVIVLAATSPFSPLCV